MLNLLQKNCRCSVTLRNYFATYPVIARMQNKVIIKHEENDSRFTFSFIYSFKNNSPGRQFNLCRELEESSVQFVQRLQTNVSKVITKHHKKKKDEDQKVCARFYSDKDRFVFEDIETAKDLIYFPGIKMNLNGTDYDLVINPPLVEEVKIAEPILSTTFVYPFKLQAKFTDSQKFEWFVSKEPREKNRIVSESKKIRTESLSESDWKKRGEGFLFVPETEDIGGRLRLDVTPMCQEVTGDTTTALSTTLVEAGPDASATMSRQLWTREFRKHPYVRVMSYNILADLYADSDFSRTELFPHCPPFALEFQYRVRLIVNELVNFKADVICIQENDRKVFNYDLYPVLTHLGYEGEFNKKGGKVDEGLSVFFRKDRFVKLESKGVVLSENLQEPRFSHIWEKIKTNEALVERMVKRTTAIHVVTLQSKDDPSKFLVVGNTHLYYKPDADHVRLLQVDMCLTELQLQRKEILKRYPDAQIGILLCGDFNSTPPFGVLKYCTEGKIEADYPDWSSSPGEEVKELTLQHSFSLGSACGTPKYTNYTLGFKDCLDYIFYDKSAFYVEQVIPMPTEEELALNAALPNVSFPSDHISILADLKWL